MKSLFEKNTLQEIIQRLDKLTPNAERQWGKMDAAQMMAHCSAALEVATGKKITHRIFLGKILGPFLKSMYSDEKPFKKTVLQVKVLLL